MAWSEPATFEVKSPNPSDVSAKMQKGCPKAAFFFVIMSLTASQLAQQAYPFNQLNPFESAVYLFEPGLIIAQRKPMVAVAESSAMKRRVPGER